MTIGHLGPVTPSELWSAWSFDPLTAAAIAIAIVGYMSGTRRLPGRQRPNLHTAAFAGAIGVMVVVVMSPLDALSETLFTAHMVQHLVLILMVPPLLFGGRTARTLLMGLPGGLRRRVGRTLRSGHRAAGGMLHPAVVGAAHAIVLWSWHAPGPYEAALDSELVHFLEHATFLVTALGIWRFVFDRRANLGTRIAVVFGTTLQSGLLAAALLFAQTPLYPSMAPNAASWGLTPLSDQQLAAVVMWVPMGLIYLTVILAIALRGFRKLEAVSHA